MRFVFEHSMEFELGTRRIAEGQVNIRFSSLTRRGSDFIDSARSDV
ncbi:MAG: hypothetical protein HKN47_11570 [Pirellulaceae bacterium]|nr:hypothetical protein [Pirellulaceae bacterium]